MKLPRFKMALLVAGCASAIATACVTGAKTDGCEKIAVKHTRAQIEEVIKDEKSPESASEWIKDNVKFEASDALIYGPCCDDRWTSLQELMAVGKGDCEDGAIAFKALLSDNPEYEVKVVRLFANQPRNDRGHTVAIMEYKQQGKWGYASFNDFRGDTYKLSGPAFESMEDAIANVYPEMFREYSIVNFSDKDIKFGRVLQDKLKESSTIPKIIDWLKG